MTNTTWILFAKNTKIKFEQTISQYRKIFRISVYNLYPNKQPIFQYTSNTSIYKQNLNIQPKPQYTTKASVYNQNLNLQPISQYTIPQYITNTSKTDDFL